MSNVTKFTPPMQPARPYTPWREPPDHPWRERPSLAGREEPLAPVAVPVSAVQAICREKVAEHTARRASDAVLSTEQERDARLLGALSYALPALYTALCQHAQHRDYCGIFDGRERCSCPLASVHALARSVLHQLADRGDALSQRWATEALDLPGAVR